MTIADTDITLLKEKINLLIDEVFINESFPYSGGEYVIAETYKVKVYATLEESEEKIGTIRIILKSL